MAAILSGGILLTRMTLKNLKDARQKPHLYHPCPMN